MRELPFLYYAKTSTWLFSFWSFSLLTRGRTGIRLSDLKRNPQLAANVFNTLFNLDKYLDHEQRDPFASASSLSHEAQEGESDWDKYATAEYENLIAEESPADHM